MYKLLFYSILFSLVPASPVFGATLLLDPNPAFVFIGQTIDVTVHVADVFDAPRTGDEVIGFGFDITNSNLGAFQLLGFTMGPLFEDFSPLPGTDVFGLVTGAPITDPLANPPLLLAILHFQAISSGSSQIDITSDPFDLNEGLQYLSSASAAFPLNGSLTLTATAIPEPSSLVLLSAGLLALSVRRFRRRSARRD